MVCNSLVTSYESL